MTLLLVDNAPRDACTVQVTPRRCQQFRTKAGERVRWANRAADGSVLGEGEVVADPLGLVTIPDVVVTKDGNRLVLAR